MASSVDALLRRLLATKARQEKILAETRQQIADLEKVVPDLEKIARGGK